MSDPTRFSLSRSIPAPADRIYRLLADYRDGHPCILPKRYFSPLSIEAGGVGAGTVASFEMTGFGGRRRFHMTVSEPQPGRVLRETYADSGAVTTFTLTPAPDGHSTAVEIATVMAFPRGPLGWLQRRMTGAFLRRVYAEELTLLAEVTAGR